MKTLEQVYDILESINDQAHGRAWDTWTSADAEEDDELAEELREEASAEQSDWFRNFYWQLSDEDRRAVVYWIIKDEDLADQFKTWYDPDVFDEEIDLE